MITGIATTTMTIITTTTAEPPPLLTLVQWLSPAFPTGAFAYSHGLEAVIARGMVRDASTLADWLRGLLDHGSARQEAALLAAALSPRADHAALDATARALAPSSERLEETFAQGAAFARTVAALTGRALPPRALPVAVGEAVRPLGLPRSKVIALYLQAFLGNLCVIATRHVPLGQTQGQAVLAALAPAIARAARCARACDLGSGALAADLAAMQHEQLDIRIFRT